MLSSRLSRCLCCLILLFFLALASRDMRRDVTVTLPLCVTEMSQMDFSTIEPIILSESAAERFVKARADAVHDKQKEA